MARNFSSHDPYQQPDSSLLPDRTLYDDHDGTPSLPIILLSAACGLSSGIIGLYLAYSVLHFSVPLSSAVATLCLLFGLGIVGAGLSVLSHSQAAWANIGFSCGLIIITLLFFGLCMLAGALAATLLLFLGA